MGGLLFKLLVSILDQAAEGPSTVGYQQGRLVGLCGTRVLTRARCLELQCVPLGNGTDFPVPELNGLPNVGVQVCHQAAFALDTIQGFTRIVRADKPEFSVSLRDFGELRALRVEKASLPWGSDTCPKRQGLGYVVPFGYQVG